MYLGRIVERGTVGAGVRRAAPPLHADAARCLADARPAQRGVLPRVTGEIPSAAAPPPGCHFHPRCPRASTVCRTVYPAWEEADGHGWACHHPH